MPRDSRDPKSRFLGLPMSGNLLEIFGTEWRRLARWCGYAVVIFVPSPSYAQSSGTDGNSTTIIWLLLLALYFLPSIIAGHRKHRNRGAIKALNLLLGWTFVGWVIALVWSLTADTEEESVVGRILIEKDRGPDLSA